MKIQIIVDDESKAHEAEKRAYQSLPHIVNHLKPRPKGTIHCEMDIECPNGGKNCRNCGDPLFKEACSKAGHCPHCGTRHGVAPNSVLAANGYKLVVIE